MMFETRRLRVVYQIEFHAHGSLRRCVANDVSADLVSRRSESPLAPLVGD